MSSIIKVDTIQDQDGNNIINENANTITIGASGDTITIPSGATLDLSNATQTGVGGENTPFFLARLTSNQSPSDAVNTKLEFSDEIYDSDNCYDPTTNYRFTPTVAGYYFCFAHARCSANADAINDIIIEIEFNGSSNVSRAVVIPADNTQRDMMMYAYGIQLFNGSTDYIEARINIDVTAGGTPEVDGGAETQFGAFKLIGT